MTEPPFDFDAEEPDLLPTEDAGDTAEGEESLLRRRAKMAARIVAMIAAVTLILIGASALVTNLFESRRATVQRFGSDVDLLVVVSENGEIVVTAAAGSEIVIERDERYVFRRPSREAELSGSTLVVDDGCPSFNLLFLGGCRVDFRITVPANIAVDLESSNGDLVIEGIAGGVVVRTSNGDIDLDRLSGEIDADTSNGSIVGRQLSAPSLIARTSNGRITLSFEEAPNRVEARTSNGDIDLEVPDLHYRIDANTSNGDIDLEVVSDPDAPRTIDVTSSNGNIDIRRQ